MRRTTFRVAVLLLFASACTICADRAHAEVTAQQVNETIDRAVGFLKRAQLRRGDWESYANEPGGATALCTLALLEAGVPKDDPAVAKALDYLRTLEPERVYSRSLITMALCRADPARDRALIGRNVRWLQEAQVKSGDMRGAWAYTRDGRLGGGDHSNAQFAMLALYDAEMAGVPSTTQTWRDALSLWLKNQNPDGSWGYKGQQPGYGSMTTAGIASVTIAQDRLKAREINFEANRLPCCGEQETVAAVDKGVDWLSKNFSVRTNPSYRGWYRYYLYGMERAGRLTHRRFFGSHDWYRAGVERLVADQDKLSGKWTGIGPENKDHIATALTLLFIAKGRRPVLMLKANYGDGEQGNQHPLDLVNLTRYVDKTWETPLTWQEVNTDGATVSDYAQAPVLFLNGSQAFTFDARQKKRLREFVDQGGFIFAEQTCNGAGFDQSFRALIAELFPEQKLDLLPLEHPIWSMEEKVPNDYMRRLLGIDVGCRTSVVYAMSEPDRFDLSCYWHVDRNVNLDELPQQAQNEIKAARSIGINVLAYATNRELKPKDAIPRVIEQNTVEIEDKRGHLAIAKLRHTGGCDAAPQALSNLLLALGNAFDVRVASEPPLLDIADENIYNYHMLFLHGRHDFTLSSDERQALRLFVERGGIILADSICASPQFATAFRREMSAIWRDKPFATIPVEHPMFTEAYGGADIRTVSRRESFRADDGPIETKTRQVAPELQGLKFDDRWGVIFSPFDISCALEKRESPQCKGYTREDAARIAINVILYSLND